MNQFKALACGGRSGQFVTLPLLAAYLDEHTLPAEIGELTLSSLVAHESIVKDPQHPSYYFCTSPTATLAGGFASKPKVQDQAATGTFAWDQLPNPSPPVKAKSPSAVIGAGFIPSFSLSL